MAHIVRQIARLLTALVVVYGALLALSLVFVPPTAVDQRLDTGRAAASLFLTEPKYVFMARGRLNSTSDKVLLLGASNVQAGFKQAELQAELPAVEVHNLAVGGSNISQVEQIVGLVREVQSPAARQHNRYVIGLWYGLFAEDQARWYTPDRHGGDTDIDIERYRYGFYRRTDHGPVPLVSPRYLGAEVVLIHPYLVLDRATRAVTQSLRDFMTQKPAAMTDEQRNAVVTSDAERQQYLSFWRGYMGNTERLAETPFRILSRTVDGILAEGGQVVLVDLPLPAWHSRGSALALDYRTRIEALLSSLKSRPGVVVLRMDNDNSELDFRDEVHPKPRVAKRWAQRLAASLNLNASLPRAQAENNPEQRSL